MKWTDIVTGFTGLAGDWRLILIAFAIGATCGTAGTWRVISWKDRAAQAAEMRVQITDHVNRTEQGNGIAASYESAEAKARVENKKIDNQKEDALADKTPGVNCKLPVKRVRVIAAAIAGHATP